MNEPILSVDFYRTDAGSEPVRDWLRTLTVEDRKAIGIDIKTVQYGWPLGMPLVRKMAPDLWEIRCDIPDGIARVLFTVKNGRMVLLHGFVKKTQKTPDNELSTARNRLKNCRNSK
jgi:phage-related protein